MKLQQLFPQTVRQQLRPSVHRVRRMGRSVCRQVVDSSLWPKPADWHELKSQISAIDDPRTLYYIAAREFGILQIETEIVPFLEYIRDHRPRCAGEIGLKHGGNTFMFTRMFTEAKRFLGLDLTLQNVGKARFLARTKQRLDFIEGSSYSPAVIHRTQKLLSGTQFDFLFIDGDHEYDGVRADFLAYYDMVRSGGLIAFHDIVPDEFARTGQRTVGSQCYGGGVYRFWRELREHFPHREFVESWDQNGFGIGVITTRDKRDLPPELFAQQS